MRRPAHRVRSTAAWPGSRFATRKNIALTQPIHFDGWTLDPASGELTRGGERLRLQEQPLQVLQALLARPGQVVTREELVARLWPKGIVDFETGLNTAIRRLRAALGDDADTPRYIETLPRRGYRFIGRIEHSTQPPAQPQSQPEDRTLLVGATQPVRKRGDSLVIVHAPQQAEVGRRYSLDKDVVTLGRGAENDVVVTSQSVSRRHSRVEYRDGAAFIVDAGSTNGTFLNDAMNGLQDEPLQRGDEIVVGDRVFVYLTGPDADVQYQDIVLRAALTDGLTGASNRKQLDTLLTEEIARAQRHERPLSLLMIDIDSFRRINDHYGYLAGDAVLRRLAGLIKKRLRPQDRFGRYGGEEFCVIAPETALAGAVKFAEELRALVQESPFVAGRREVEVTISIGVICLQRGMQANELYRQAEGLLRQAKQAGRNQVAS
jgi:diguanylate cyclase (GGDEF)-like protein